MADAAWSRNVVQQLLDHVTRSLAPLLPQHLLLLAAPGQLVLASTADGPARTVATTAVQLPEQITPDDLEFVARSAERVAAVQEAVVVQQQPMCRSSGAPTGARAQ